MQRTTNQTDKTRQDVQTDGGEERIETMDRRRRRGRAGMLAIMHAEIGAKERQSRQGKRLREKRDMPVVITHAVQMEDQAFGHEREQT